MLAGLRDSINRVAPNLSTEINELCGEWVAPILAQLDLGSIPTFPKIFTDPVWGTIEFFPVETLLLDSPLLQRLRGVRQLGMAHHVYPGAGHDRLEHSRGVVEAAARILSALAKNAHYRTKYGDIDRHVPPPSELDIASIRLAALLHDIGHGPFSHATEILIENRYEKEITDVSNLLREHFEGTTAIATSEVFAVLMILSIPLKNVFEHPRFEAPKKPDLPFAIASRILGSRSFLDAGYLSGVISGPLDADKLDYMSRDSHHAGLPLGLDINRLISKLEVVTITPDNALSPELKERAQSTREKRFYEMGISVPGLGAYEQMIIARVMLYDRIYYHHKVKSAEAMVRKLYMLAEEESEHPLTLKSFFVPESDDSVIGILSGRVSSDEMKSGKGRSKSLGTALKSRDLYYKAFAFASRFIGGLSGYSEKTQTEHKALIWGKAERRLGSFKSREDFADKIYKKATELAGKIAPLAEYAAGFSPEHVIVDLPEKKVTVSEEILAKSHDGQISTPNLFFNPQKWSEAYELQKQCGFIFTPRKYVPLVAIASKIVFYEQLQLLTTHAADLASKTVGVIKREWIERAVAESLCSPECGVVLTEAKPLFATFEAEDFSLPDSWKDQEPEMAKRIADAFNTKLPAGIPLPQKKKAITHFRTMISFLEMIEKNGEFAKVTSLKEATLQQSLLQHLRSREIEAQEGTEYGGGETDIILPDNLIVENKVIHTSTNDPFHELFLWQARRYSTSLLSMISYGVIGYKPKDEIGYLPLPKRIKVVASKGDNVHVQLQFAVPYDFCSPSEVKVPA